MYIAKNYDTTQHLQTRLSEDMNPKVFLKKRENIMGVVLIALMCLSLVAFLFSMFWFNCKPRRRNRQQDIPSRVRWPRDPLAGYRERIHDTAYRLEAYEIPDEPLTELEPCAFRYV